jgi:predicted ABC-type ATPase
MTESKPIPRVRLFAGPNGSGKSYLKTLLSPSLLGIYINPDEIEEQLQQGWLDLTQYQVRTTSETVKLFVMHSMLAQRIGMIDHVEQLHVVEGQLRYGTLSPNSYLASVLADFIRQYLVDILESFTFESVMSSPDKVHLLRQARLHGYRTYLYYIATADPDINVARVRNRVLSGGHDVPHDKIISRYYRSLDLLPDAIAASNRAFIFDNSNDGKAATWIAEITDGQQLIMKTNTVPAWFKNAVTDQMTIS